MLCSLAIGKLFGTPLDRRWINEGLFNLQWSPREVAKSQSNVLNVLATQILIDQFTTQKAMC